MNTVAQRKFKYGAENEISLLAAKYFVQYDGQFPPDIVKRCGPGTARRSSVGLFYEACDSHHCCAWAWA